MTVTVADPSCCRCGRRATWIGIAGAAQAICSVGCAGKCPKCLSLEIEPFVAYGYWGLGGPSPSTSLMHCIPCGAVFEEKP